MKDIDIAKVAFDTLVSIIDQIENIGEKPHVYVMATERFIKDNPVFKNAIHHPDPKAFPTGIVTLNLSSAAIRFLSYENNMLSFTTRVNKVEQNVFIFMGDLLGIGAANSEAMAVIYDPCSLITSPLVGRIILRPLDSTSAAEVIRHVENPQAELPMDPDEQAPRSRSHLTVVKN